MLTKQSASIVTEHFMIEPTEKEAELHEIDSVIMMRHVHEKFKGTPVGTIINGLNLAPRRRAIQEVIKRNHDCNYTILW